MRLPDPLLHAPSQMCIQVAVGALLCWSQHQSSQSVKCHSVLCMLCYADTVSGAAYRKHSLIPLPVLQQHILSRQHVLCLCMGETEPA